MDAKMEQLLRLINGDIDNSDPTGDSEKRLVSDTDLELLDAYSQAVVSVVDSVGPSVVSISGGKNQGHPAADQVGAGSGPSFQPIGLTARLPARLRPVGDYAPEGRAYCSERGRTRFSMFA